MGLGRCGTLFDASIHTFPWSHISSLCLPTKALAKLERKAHPVPRYLSNATGFCIRGTLNDDAWHRITTYSRDLNVLFT